jgi:aconitate hydratase
MGVLPLQFKNGDDASTLKLQGDEIYSLKGVDHLKPGQEAELVITKEGKEKRIPVIVRLDTPIEVDYYRHGGIMTFVLRHLMGVDFS